MKIFTNMKECGLMMNKMVRVKKLIMMDEFNLDPLKKTKQMDSESLNGLTQIDIKVN